MGSVYRPSYTVKVKDSETGVQRRERRRSRTWFIRYYRNGRRHQESSHSTKKGDAVRLLKLREGDVAKGVPVTPAVGRLTFEEAAAAVVTDYRVNGKRSLPDVERRIKLHLEPYFGGRRMAAVTTANVRSYTEQRLEAGAAAASINRELAILKRTFSLAVKDGRLLARPHVPMLIENNTRQGFFEIDEFKGVRDALPAELQGLVTFLYLTGWRVGEARPLEWSQVDRKRRTVRLEPGSTKNRDGRTLPYGSLPELVEVLERQWSERDRLAKAGTIYPYVFHRAGKPIRSFRGAWERACREAGVPGRLVHDLRRTAVRNLVRAGVPDTVAMRISGHKTRAVFDRYNVTSESDLAAAMGALSGWTGQDSGKRRQTGRVAEFARSS